MRIGDQIQISGKKITPLKSKSTTSSVKKTETIGVPTNSSKGQIIASKIVDKTTYFLLKPDVHSSPRWEEKEKLLVTHRNVIEKYERQQKAFLASQQQQVQRPIVITNSDDSDEDKNKINGKRKLCIGGKAPTMNNSGKKVCNEANKEGQATNTNQFSTKLQEIKNKFQDGNLLSMIEKQRKATSTIPDQSAAVSTIFIHQNNNQQMERRNNLFDQTSYYNVPVQDKLNTEALTNQLADNNANVSNSKVNHKMLFESQVNPIMNPKNIAKIIEKQAQKESIIFQQIPIVQENSKNFSDIENISHLNNSISEDFKNDIPTNKNQSNKQNNNTNNNNQIKEQTVYKPSSTNPVFFKKDDLDLAKKKTSSESPKNPIQKSIEQYQSIFNKILSPNKNTNTNNNNKSNVNTLNQVTKSKSSDEGKSKLSTVKENDVKTKQRSNSSTLHNAPAKKANIPAQNKTTINPTIEEEEMTQDNIVLKKKDNFGEYLQSVFGFKKNTPKNSSITNVYSPSKSPMIDAKKINNKQTQSQYQDSQIEGPPKDGPLNEVIHQNFQRLTEIISNSEKKKLNRSSTSSDLNHIEQEGDFLNQKEHGMEVEDVDVKSFEREKADYSQFQNQLMQDYIESRPDAQEQDEFDEEDEEDQKGYVLQLEKGNSKQNQESEKQISQQSNNNKFNYKGLQVERQEKMLKVTLPQNKINEQQQKELQSTFESTQQDEYKNGENIKNLVSFNDKNQKQLLTTENILPASLESNFSSTQAESSALFITDLAKINALPESGNFSYGDKAKKIMACKPRENEIMMEIEWEARPNGKIPEKSSICSKIVRQYDHNLLIDFYESKIKFTYKNAEKKKQTQSLNASVKKEYNSPNQNQ